MITALQVTTTPHVQRALASLGRTEDVRFSPSGSRLAIAGFGADELSVIDLEVMASVDVAAPGSPAVHIVGMVQIQSASLHEPHGISFLDEDTLVVANRHAEVPIYRLPPAAPGLRRIDLDPVQTLRADDVHGLKSPGSVVTARLAADLYEIVVCNNYADNVSRHVVDARDDYRVLSSDVIVQWGLEIPDGATISRDGRWLAISNHNTHSVFVHEMTEHLGPDTPPYGVLENVNYPHGLCFTADGRRLLVADAGAPYVHVFDRGGDDWRGTRQPVSVVKVMADQQYLAGRYNTQEGGPKGIDIDRSMRLVVVSSEHQALDFFAATEFIAGIEPVADTPTANAPPCGGHGLESTRTALLRALGAAEGATTRAAAATGRAADAENALADRDVQLADLQSTVAALGAAAIDAATELARVRGELASASAAAAVATDAARLEREAAIAAERTARTHTDAAVTYLQGVVADREHQLDAIRRSNWWRLTAIPRRLLSMTRRLRGL